MVKKKRKSGNQKVGEKRGEKSFGYFFLIYYDDWSKAMGGEAYFGL